MVEEGSDLFSHYEAEVMQITDYSPFGAPLPGRTYNAMEDLNKVEIANQTFASGVDGWSTVNSNTTVANSSNRLRLQTTNTNAVSMSKTYTTAADKHYRISFDADAAAYTNVSIDILGYGGNALSSATLNTGVTHYELDFVANDASTVIRVSLGTGTGTRTIYIDNVKLEEIKGDVKGYFAGYNGKENENEMYGTGNAYDYGFRIYNPRLGRFLSTDPLFREYPWYTPYQFAGNKPITSIDLDGLEEFDYREMPLADGKVMVSITAGKKLLDQAYQKVTDANGNKLWDFRYQKIQNVMDKATYGRPGVKNATTGFTMTLPYDPNTAVFSGGQSPQSPIVKNKEGESFQTNITTAYFIVDPAKDALVKNQTEFGGTSNGRGNSTLQFNVKATSGSAIFEYKNVSVGDKYTITDSDGNIIYESSFLVGEGSFNFTFTNLSSPVVNVNVQSQDTDDSNSAWGFDMCVTPTAAEE